MSRVCRSGIAGGSSSRSGEPWLKCGRSLPPVSFTARRLADFGVTADRITVAEPGVAISAGLQRAQKTHDSIPQILCVGHLSPRKAQHQLVKALQNLKGLPWRCTLAGALDRDRGVQSAGGAGDTVSGASASGSFWRAKPTTSASPSYTRAPICSCFPPYTRGTAW